MHNLCFKLWRVEKSMFGRFGNETNIVFGCPVLRSTGSQ